MHPRRHSPLCQDSHMDSIQTPPAAHAARLSTAHLTRGALPWTDRRPSPLEEGTGASGKNGFGPVSVQPSVRNRFHLVLPSTKGLSPWVVLAQSSRPRSPPAGHTGHTCLLRRVLPLTADRCHSDGCLPPNHRLAGDSPVSSISLLPGGSQ